MKKILLPFLAALVLLPNMALASTFVAGEEVFISEAVSEDLYSAGGLLNVKNDVNGDLVAGGGSVYVDGNISQDVMMGGGDVTLNGEIGDDVRVIGGSLKVDATIKGDLIAAGGDVNITDDTFVGGDMNLAAGNIVAGGEVNGDLRVAVGAIYLNTDVKGDAILANFDSIKFGPGARIQGNLSYRAHEPLEIPEGVVQGEVIFKEIQTPHVEESVPAIIAGFSLYSFLATLFFGLFMIWLFRHYVTHTANTAYESTLKSLGIGFLILLLTPIVALVFLITTIGVPVALVLIAMWAVFLYVGKIMAAMLIGFKVVRVNSKSSFGRVFGSFALGALIYTLVGMVPVVGWVINFLIVLIALGSMASYESEVFVELRKKKLV